MELVDTRIKLWYCGSVASLGLAVFLGLRLGMAPLPTSIPELQILRQRSAQVSMSDAESGELEALVLGIADRIAAIVDGPLRVSRLAVEADLDKLVANKANDPNKDSRQYQSLGSAGLRLARVNGIESDLRRACALGVEISYAAPEAEHVSRTSNTYREFVRLIGTSLSSMETLSRRGDPYAELAAPMASLRDALNEFHAVWNSEGTLPERLDTHPRSSVNPLTSVTKGEINEFGARLFSERMVRSEE